MCLAPWIKCSSLDLILGAALAAPATTTLALLTTEGFIGTAIHVGTVLGRITLHAKARSVQEKAHDTMRKNKWRERECKKVQKI